MVRRAAGSRAALPASEALGAMAPDPLLTAVSVLQAVLGVRGQRREAAQGPGAASSTTVHPGHAALTLSIGFGCLTLVCGVPFGAESFCKNDGVVATLEWVVAGGAMCGEDTNCQAPAGLSAASGLW